jgi:tetrahydromethanopterin S-methyltransferase subunit G
MFEKYMRCGTFPLRVGRREMIANVTSAAGGQQRIGQRVQRDIRIRVASSV